DGIRDYKVTGVQTCALPIYDEDRQPFVLRTGRVRPADELADVAFLRGGRPDLLAADQPSVAVAGRRRANAGEVRAGIGLAEELRSEERRVGKECRVRGAGE